MTISQSCLEISGNATHIASKEIEKNRREQCLLFQVVTRSKRQLSLAAKSATYNEDTMKIMPLHSSVPKKRKISIYARERRHNEDNFVTNIAESSVTIDDVLSVVGWFGARNVLQR